jgi:hypothetical protein
MPIEATERSPRPPPRARLARALSVFALFGGVALLILWGAVPCAFARMTGHPCPGCGSTRAVYALARGDLVELLHANPLGPLMALLVAVFGAHVVSVVWRDGSTAAVSDSRLGRLLVRATLVVALGQVALWGARFFGALGGPVVV